MTDFKQLLHVLANARVEFVVVGGMAALVHGVTRLTEDLDIVYRRTQDNIDRLAVALSPHQPYLRGAPPNRFWILARGFCILPPPWLSPNLS